MFGLCLFFSVLLWEELGVNRQWKVGSAQCAIEMYMFLLQMASLFSLKQRQGQLVQTPLPTPQCGCYFLIAAAWNFCSCLQKPPFSVYEIWLLGKHCLTAVSLTCFFHPAIVEEALSITMTACSLLIKCMCISLFRDLYIMLLLLALVSDKCGVTQYNDSVLHVISYGALRGP